MPAPQNFRSAFNGFNREDVVHYLEYLNSKHTAQVNQLTSEADFLRTKLESRQDTPGQAEVITALTEERDALAAQVEELTRRCAALEARLAEVPEAPAYSAAEELEAYRRAERTERIAKERAKLVYHQINGILSDTTARVDGVAAEVGGMADQVMAQLNQLQAAIGSSKQALKDAASTMYAIRPAND